MRKREKYTIEYFLQKFRSIPLDKWTMGALRRQDGSRCALGHCGPPYWGGLSEEAQALTDLLGGADIVRINDFGTFWRPTGRGRNLRSRNPRGRILEALRLVQRRSKRQSKRGAR